MPSPTHSLCTLAPVQEWVLRVGAKRRVDGGCLDPGTFLDSERLLVGVTSHDLACWSRKEWSPCVPMQARLHPHLLRPWAPGSLHSVCPNDHLLGGSLHQPGMRL